MPKAQKDKKNKAVHPLSRTAAQMARSARKEQKADDKLKEKAAKLENLGEKLKWFQDSLEGGKAAYTREEACDLIDKYLGRFSDELEQIDIVNSMKGRTGNQHASRRHVINVIMEKERREFENQGFEIPDIINGKHLKAFREWTGELRLIPNIKLRLVKPVPKQSTESKDSESKNSSTQNKSVTSKSEKEMEDDS